MASKSELLQLASLSAQASSAFAGGRPGNFGATLQQSLAPAIEQAQRQEFEKEQKKRKKNAIKGQVISTAASLIPIPGVGPIAGGLIRAGIGAGTQEALDTNTGSFAQTFGNAALGDAALMGAVGGKLGGALGKRFGSTDLLPSEPGGPLGAAITAGEAKGIAKGTAAGGELSDLFGAGKAIDLEGTVAPERFTPSGFGLSEQQVARINQSEDRREESRADQQIRETAEANEQARFNKRIALDIKNAKDEQKFRLDLEELRFTNDQINAILNRKSAESVANIGATSRTDVEKSRAATAIETANIAQTGATERAGKATPLHPAEVERIGAETDRIRSDIDLTTSQKDFLFLEQVNNTARANFEALKREFTGDLPLGVSLAGEKVKVLREFEARGIITSAERKRLAAFPIQSGVRTFSSTGQATDGGATAAPVGGGTEEVVEKPAARIPLVQSVVPEELTASHGAVVTKIEAELGQLDQAISIKSRGFASSAAREVNRLKAQRKQLQEDLAIIHTLPARITAATERRAKGTVSSPPGNITFLGQLGTGQQDTKVSFAQSPEYLALRDVAALMDKYLGN